jgi:uncharacterized protein YjbJ (UPF0337 family)
LTASQGVLNLTHGTFCLGSGGGGTHHHRGTTGDFPVRYKLCEVAGRFAIESVGSPSAAIAEMVNCAQTSQCHEIKKETALKHAIQASRGPRWNMKTSTKDRIKGSFHEVAGTIKEGVGNVSNDRNLKAEGKAEKKEGKVQQKIGHAKEAVADLKDKLAELKTR